MFDGLDTKTAAPQRGSGMIALGYGAYIRADVVFAVIPIEGPARGEGRRTYVYVDGLPEPLVASRSERAILADIERVLTHEPVEQQRSRLFRRGAHRVSRLAD